MKTFHWPNVISLDTQTDNRKYLLAYHSYQKKTNLFTSVWGFCSGFYLYVSVKYVCWYKSSCFMISWHVKPVRMWDGALQWFVEDRLSGSAPRLLLLAFRRAWHQWRGVQDHKMLSSRMELWISETGWWEVMDSAIGLTRAVEVADSSFVWNLKLVIYFRMNWNQRLAILQ